MKPIWTTVALALAAAIATTPAFAQRLYNQAQDQRAEAALALGRHLAAESAFDKAVANLGELQKLRNEDVFRSGRLLMKAEMGSWRTWDDLDASIAAIARSLQQDISGDAGGLPAALARAKESETQAQSELAELAKALTVDETPERLNLAGTWLERISKVKPLADYLNGLAVKDKAAADLNTKAAEKAQAGLQELAQLYKDFRLSLPPKPSTLFLESKLAALDLEVQHIENLMAIQERLDGEMKDIRSLLNASRNGVAKFKPLFNGKTIQESLDQQAAAARKSGGAETETLGEMLFLLYNASALAARNHTPVRLAQQRETLEQRAHSLRLAAASTSAYEAILVNGLERLALYHKGGIRPATVASLIQALSTAGLIPAIALK